MSERMRVQRRGKHIGQALVEFALILPIFMLMLFGLVDAGRLVYSNAALSQAVREGARLATAEGGWIGLAAQDPSCVATPANITSANPGAHVCPATVASFKSDVVAAVNRMAVNLGSITNVYISCNLISDPAPAGAWTEASGGNGCKTPLGEPNASHGYLVSVRITYTYQSITPIFSSVFPTVPLSSAATMVIN